MYSERDVDILNEPPTTGAAAATLKGRSQLSEDATHRRLMQGRGRRGYHDFASQDLGVYVSREGKKIVICSQPAR